MAQQTAIDWFAKQVEENLGWYPVEIIQQANQMFEEQVKKAYNDALAAEEKVDYFTTVPSAEQYYNETYNQNK